MCTTRDLAPTGVAHRRGHPGCTKATDELALHRLDTPRRAPTTSTQSSRAQPVSNKPRLDQRLDGYADSHSAPVAKAGARIPWFQMQAVRPPGIWTAKR